MQDPILIVGASGTIGAAIAKKLKQENFNLILHGRVKNQKLKKIGDELSSPIIYGDFSKSDVVEREFLKLNRENKNLLGLVFSIAEPFLNKLTLNTPWSSFEKQLNSQLKAFHEIMIHSKSLLTHRSNGSKVLVISTEYLLGSTPIKIMPYIAAKSALTAYAKGLAKELLPLNIRLHILAPGMVRSNLTNHMPEEFIKIIENKLPEKKLTSAEDIASISNFLLNEDSDILYGNIIHASRGDRL